MEEYSFKHFDNDDLALWYKGNFDDQVTEHLIDLAEADVNQGSLGKSRKKISFLMAESFQNIVRHAIRDGEQEKVIGSFGITNRSGQFHIFSANHIDELEGENIDKKLRTVNNLDADELKAYYKDILFGGGMSDKGGAGLGLIEMARKSGKPLQYKFIPLGGKSEFCLQIDKSIDNEETSSNMDIAESVEIHQKFEKNGVLLYFKGDFDKDSTMNMVRMLSENTSKQGNQRIDKIIFHVGVEMLQNIKRHGLEVNGKTQGEFIFAFKDGHVILVAKNYLNSEQIIKLTEHLDKLNANNEEELSKWYKKQLRASVAEETNNAGIGLIDVRRITSSKIEYSFDEKADGTQVQIAVKIPAN